MPRLKPIPRDEVSDEFTLKMYDFMFGDRDPVAELAPSVALPATGGR